jgi:biopolymer transport protein ExbB
MTMGCDINGRRQRALRRATANLLTGLLLGLVAALTLFPSQAKAWWNDEWQLRKKITIDASASGANITDPIGATPVLVRLHVGNFRFGSAKEDGSDLRFVASDDKTPLKHHIEKYDSLLGEALVWVAVPNLQPGAKTEIWLYSGNKKAVATSDSKATYDPEQLLVYHFNERGTPALDSSVWANNAQSVGQPADGSLIGTGLRLDGRVARSVRQRRVLVVRLDQAGRVAGWCRAVQPPRRRERGGDRPRQRRTVCRGDECGSCATQRRRHAGRAKRLASSCGGGEQWSDRALP